MCDVFHLDMWDFPGEINPKISEVPEQVLVEGSKLPTVCVVEQ
jgi:hypothetical protein